MQAIILAAGLAKRLRPLTDLTPKCLLDVGGKNLLHRTIENITLNGIRDFVIVTGYREEMITEYMEKNFKDINVKFLSNTDYASNNNSYSLWMTKVFVNGDAILLDSDIFFDAGIIAKLLRDGHENSLAVNVTHELDEEQIKITADSGGRIIEIGKEIPVSKAIGESIGIEKFSKQFLGEMYGILDRKIKEENNVNEFYEVTFQEIISSGSERNSIFYTDVSEYKCIEIDTPEDYYKVQKEFNI